MTDRYEKNRRLTVNDLIERLRAVKWKEVYDDDRMPDDPTHKCVLVDMRPDDFRDLLREATDALEAARGRAMTDRYEETIDARLIAAAPELLAALKGMEKWASSIHDGYPPSTASIAAAPYREAARAAIAKATGEVK